mmetsp:Transcript_6379/g.11980  ORF Transcript_6379/g.11980 Transcript_6379/m.11980 type:complete len:248 (-) Transcript_6379:139-882(-)
MNRCYGETRVHPLFKRLCSCCLLKQLQVPLVCTMTRADAAQLANELRNSLDCLHLICKVGALDVIRELRVVRLLRNLVQGKQLFVVELFERESKLHGVQRVPLVCVSKVHVRHHDGLELHLAAAGVLVLHHHLRVLALLRAGFLEVLGQARQRHVVAVEVGKHGVVDVADVVLNIDLIVECRFTGWGVVLAGKGFIVRGGDAFQRAQWLKHHSCDGRLVLHLPSGAAHTQRLATLGCSLSHSMRGLG